MSKRLKPLDELYNNKPKQLNRESHNTGNYLFFFFSFHRQIPKQGNTAQLILSVLHRNFLGLDHLLGQTVIPLAEIDVYERPKSKYVFIHIRKILFFFYLLTNGVYEVFSLYLHLNNFKI